MTLFEQTKHLFAWFLFEQISLIQWQIENLSDGEGSAPILKVGAPTYYLAKFF